MQWKRQAYAPELLFSLLQISSAVAAAILAPQTSTEIPNAGLDQRVAACLHQNKRKYVSMTASPFCLFGPSVVGRSSGVVSALGSLSQSDDFAVGYLLL